MKELVNRVVMLGRPSRTPLHLNSGQPSPRGGRLLLDPSPEPPSSDESCDGGGWRDWANLLTELRENIAGRLAASDVSEYIRFRATCRPWRDCTDDPRGGGMDRRFRPRSWIVLSHSSAAPPYRRRHSLLHTTTGANIDVDLPQLENHVYLTMADGLLVLCHRDSKAISLLNPLTGVLTELPSVATMASLQNPLAYPPRQSHITITAADQDSTDGSTLKVLAPASSMISSAGIDDSTSTPTLVLCLKEGLSPDPLMCAKSGDQSWAPVHVVGAAPDEKLVFHSLASFQGRCYTTTVGGVVMVLDQASLESEEPRMVPVELTETPAPPAPANGGQSRSSCYLTWSRNRLIMLRQSHRHPASPEPRMEMLQVDIAGGRRRLLISLEITGSCVAKKMIGGFACEVRINAPER